VVAHQVGKNDIAVDLISKSLAINTEYAEAHNNLGRALQHLGRLDEAIASFKKALAINPSYVEAYINLGNAFQDQGHLDEAVGSFEKAISINPGFSEAHNNLGQLLKEMGRLEDAVTEYRKALAIKSDFPEAHVNLGNVLMDLGLYDQAISSFQKALAINPDFIEAYHGLGVIFGEMGNFEEAEASYRQILAIKPDYTEAYLYLANLRKFSEDGNDIITMEKMYALPGQSDEQRMHLAFALGKSLEDLGQYERAFGFFTEGNAIKRRGYDYSIHDQENFFKRLEGAFDNSVFATHQQTGCNDDTPIFIIGMPRSGTTLVEQILASHPQVYGAGELEYLTQIVSSSYDHVNDCNFPESIQHVDDAFFLRSGVEYIQAIRKHSPDIPFITDKMPINFMYVGLIKLMLPKAKVIHCRRDPVDTCLSIFKNYFIGKHEYSHDLIELGRYYGFYSALMEHWHKVVPGFIHDVQYEEMVANQTTQTKSLLEYCGLEWNDDCLEFHKTDRLVKTASLEQVRRPIYKDSIQSWRRYERQLQPLIEIIS